MKKTIQATCGLLALAGGAAAYAADATPPEATNLPRMTVTESVETDYAPPGVSSSGTKTATAILDTPMAIHAVGESGTYVSAAFQSATARSRNPARNEGSLIRARPPASTRLRSIGAGHAHDLR